MGNTEELTALLEDFRVPTVQHAAELDRLLSPVTGSPVENEKFIDAGSSQDRFDLEFPPVPTPTDARRSPESSRGLPRIDRVKAEIVELLCKKRGDSEHRELLSAVDAEIGRREQIPQRLRSYLSRWSVGALGALVVVVATASVFWLLGESGSPPFVPTGSLVLDAVPWAEVREITDSRGQRVPIGSDSSTPSLLELPEGRYRISLEGPGGSGPFEVRVDVRAGETTKRVVDLGRVDAEAYFGRVGW